MHVLICLFRSIKGMVGKFHNFAWGLKESCASIQRSHNKTSLHNDFKTVTDPLEIMKNSLTKEEEQDPVRLGTLHSKLMTE